jgi:anaerobic magnesium-protoporphyrin IX monomethyl ester cyclase
MKLLLIRPQFSVEKFYFPRFITESLAIEYLTSFLERYHSIKTIDAMAENWNQYWELKEYPDTIFQGIKPEKLLQKIIDYNPEIIGLTWLFSTQNDSIKLDVKTIRSFSKAVPIVVGGPQPSASPVQTLRENPGIDIVVYGEGETTMKEILDNGIQNLERIDGIAFRKNGEIILNPPRKLIENLDELPLPNRNVVPYQNYSKLYLYEALFLHFKKANINDRKNRLLTSKITSLPFLNNLYYRLYNNRHGHLNLPRADITTSRGCPNHCTFCAVHNIWGHGWRKRSAQNVLEEIEYLVSKKGMKHVNFQDDNFNVSKERTIEICKGIIKNKYNITILAASGAFVPTLDEEVLTWLKKAGLNQLRMSIESGNQNILYNVIKKNIDLAKVKKIVDICKKLKIMTEGAFIFGVPGETIETMTDSLNFAKETGFDRIIKFIFQPFPNTELFDVCVKNNYLTKDYDPRKVYITGNKCFIKTEKFAPEDVLKIINR